VPYIIRPPRKRTLVAAVTTAVVSLGVLPALAQASPACPAEATASPLLSSFGDNNEYTVLPGSRFDGATPGWTFQNASLVNEVVSTVTGGTHSLVIGPGGEAVSPAFCVSSEYPSFRFFVRRPTGYGGELSVELRYTNQYGQTDEVTSARLQPEHSWGLTPVLGLGTMLPLWQAGSTLKVQLVFQSESWWSGFAIDQVFIDPYRR
jgi:hypothetical protein